jgi:hypothetical protein
MPTKKEKRGYIMKYVMVYLLGILGLRSWLRLDDSKLYWVILGILSAVIFASLLFFRMRAQGIRSPKKKIMSIILGTSLILILLGALGYFSHDELGKILGFLRGYDTILYSVLIVTALALFATVLIIYWKERQWFQMMRARSKRLQEETEDVERSVKNIETREEEIQGYFSKTKKEIEKFKKVSDEFQGV